MPPNCDIRETGGEDRLCGIKGRNIFRQMLNSSSIHHTANMKLLLLTSVVRDLASVSLTPATFLEVTSRQLHSTFRSSVLFTYVLNIN